MTTQSDATGLLREEIYPGNTKTFADLKSFLEAGHVIAFTGAGVSAPTYPMWTTLLSKLVNDAIEEGLINDQGEIDEYQKLIHTDPLELASNLEEIFTRKVFRARLAKSFSNLNGHATESQAAISRLKLRGIITLNYDNGHEAAFAAAQSRSPNVGRSQDESTLMRWLQDEVFKDHDLPILHFHGDVSDPEQMILTADDYDRFYAERLPDILIKQLWRSNRLFVIGFGFSDPVLTRVMEGALRSIPSDIRHFALIGKKENETVSAISRKSFTKKFRLAPIFYEVRSNVDGTPDHSDLIKLLNILPKPDLSKSIELVSDGVRTQIVRIADDKSALAPTRELSSI